MSDGRRPELDPSFVPVIPDPDTVHVRAGPWTGSVTTLRDEDGDGVLGPLVEALDGTASVDDLAERLGVPPAVVSAVVDELERKGFVYDARDRETGVTGRVSDAELDRLDDRTVVVVATSGFARPAVGDLLSTGVGSVEVLPVDGREWVPADAATVEPASLAARLDAADVGLFLGDDPVPGLVTELNEQALAAETPVMYASAVGYDGVVGPFVVPGKTACYECYRRRAEQNVAAPERYRQFEQAVADGDRSPGPQLDAFGAIVAGFAVLDVCRFLTDGTGHSHGRVTHLGFDVLSMEVNDVLRAPRCDACGDRETVGVNRHSSIADLLSGGGDD